MASSTPDSVRSKAISTFNSHQRVRIVAKIRPFTDLETKSSGDSPNPWIFVQKAEPELSERVTISFHDESNSRKEFFKLDNCYDQHEDVEEIFSREVKQLVSGIYRGLNASVIVYGARGSGKTHILQGSNEKPGLAPMALAEILSACDEETSVAISCYEVCLDHVYDLLEPKEISIFEDAGGRIVLKGLSQVPVMSIAEFYKLHFHGCLSGKPVQKSTNDAPYKSHKGLIISLFSNYKNPNSRLLGKINFVDLAAHESNKMDKSLYALQNVVYALNANERVPYRESKLTRMLQDCLGEPTQNLIVTCLNPCFCQDTINTISWASRSCHVLNRNCPDSTKKAITVGRSMVLCTPKSGKAQNPSSMKKQNSSQFEFYGKNTCGVLSAKKGRKLFDRTNTSVTPKVGKNQNVIASAKKQNSSHMELFRKNSNGVSATAKGGRKLFDKGNPTINSKQEISLLSDPHAIEPLGANEEISLLSDPHAMEPLRENECVLSLPEVSTGTECDAKAFIVAEGTTEKGNDIIDEVCSNIYPAEEKGNDIVDEVSSSICVTEDKENMSTTQDASPPLSERIRELSNSLKALSSSTPVNIKMPLEGRNSYKNEFEDVLEPKTPKTEQNARSNDNMEIAITGTPREKFNLCSSGLKNSLVQEFLAFLNTASKEELKGMKGIGEKRATYILELRAESPAPFKDLSDLNDIGLTTKQINEIMRKVASGLFH